MVNSICHRPQGLVADFSVGGGELLRAAAARWPKADLFGTDIDGKTIARLRRKYKAWTLAKCDFLADARRCSALDLVEGSVGLVLLNPPFSCRGGTRFSVQFGRESVSASAALTFLIRALPFLHLKGVALVLMPAGSLTSEKDTAAWEMISQEYVVTLIAENAKNTFHPYVAKTVLVRVQRRQQKLRVAKLLERSLGRSLRDVSIVIRRGSNQVHELKQSAKGKLYRVVHSTCLRSGKATGSVGYVKRPKADLNTHAVLISRVGIPTQTKLVKHSGSPICLSDCVIALAVSSEDDLKVLWSFCNVYWNGLAALYSGTGAPYITIKRLISFLEQNGAEVLWERRR